ncbi:MAG: organic hydroperoxide resistance protein [Burkholderiales bacterium]|jgi:osmotically inducible protein OsmC|nr:organic hydroperoxide resistance protein [Burkholderiales bacterium]
MDHPKVVYTAHASATGGRDGRAVSSDGVVDVRLSVPKEMGGAGGAATNPEQLFASGYSACFLGAVKFVAGKQGVRITDDAKVSAAVGIGPIPTGFALKVDLSVSLPGVERTVAEKLVADAHIVCPYSNATRNNVEVSLTVV